MLRSMASAITALRNHQTFMDVVSNNIANINTTGFKSSRISFQDLLSQTLGLGSAPRDEAGGTNPIQVGLGMRLGGIDSIYTQGNLTATGRRTDLAIQGDGFFILQAGTERNYTRDGLIDLGVDGMLVNQTTGMRLMGWMANAAGEVDTAGPLTSLTISYGDSEARATTTALLQGNLDAQIGVGDTFASSVAVYDSQGGLHVLPLTFEKTDPNTWTWTIGAQAPATIVGGNSGTFTFETDGTYTATNPDVQFEIAFNTGAANSTITLNLSRLSQLAQASDVNAVAQDGLSAGTVIDFTINEFGEVLGLYSNGLTRTIGQVAVAAFNNPGGLLRMGLNLFRESPNSGNPQVGPAGDGMRGKISSGFLEMSNVDLAREFTDMIIAQRGFQANSRVVTTSDEILQELVNLKR